MTFKYLEIEISTSQDRIHEVTEQTNKASRISGCLRKLIWKNNYMSRETKVRIYKTCVKPIVTYATETRDDTRKTKSMLKTTEMKILRIIAEYTLRDRIHNAQIRIMCDTQDIVRWVRQRKRGWNDHVSRMTEDRIARG